MKAAIQNLLQRAGVYHRLKASRLYDLYWSALDPRISQERAKEIEFYRTVLPDLPAQGLIFDIGANHGYKTEVFLRLGSRVVSVEPDEHNLKVLNEKFFKFRMAHPPLTIVPKAISDSEGEVTFWVDAPGSAKNTLSTKWVEVLRKDSSRFGQSLNFATERKVPSTTLDRLIAEHGRPHYIKIDVEGHEPSVLRGLHSAVPVISFEVNLPEFAAEGKECVEWLSGLSARGTFNYCADSGWNLALTAWLPAREFLERLGSSNARSVEIYWRA